MEQRDIKKKHSSTKRYQKTPQFIKLDKNKHKLLIKRYL